MENININFEGFDGPMDLLFHLIEKNKMDIFDIPIAILTDKYIEYINSVPKKDMASMSEFIVMASHLVEIKSKMLLPKEVDENNQEIDPRQELVKRLVEYKIFKSVAETMGDMQKTAGLNFYKKRDDEVFIKLKNSEVKNIDDILFGVDMNILYTAFEDVMKRQELKVDTIRSKFNSIHRDLYTVEDKVNHIKNLLTLKKRVYFSQIFEEASSKLEVVISFLAVLELIKNMEISAIQYDNYGEIIIQKLEENNNEN